MMNRLVFAALAIALALSPCVASAQAVGNGTPSASSTIPVYTATGGAVSPLHFVYGTVTLLGATSIGITFTGAAVFTSGTSYTCSANGVNANQNFWFNQAGGTATTLNTSVSVTGTIPFICIGN